MASNVSSARPKPLVGLKNCSKALGINTISMNDVDALLAEVVGDEDLHGVSFSYIANQEAARGGIRKKLPKFQQYVDNDIPTEDLVQTLYERMQSIKRRGKPLSSSQSTCSQRGSKRHRSPGPEPSRSRKRSMRVGEPGLEEMNVADENDNEGNSNGPTKRRYHVVSNDDDSASPKKKRPEKSNKQISLPIHSDSRSPAPSISLTIAARIEGTQNEQEAYFDVVEILKDSNDPRSASHAMLVQVLAEELGRDNLDGYKIKSHQPGRPGGLVTIRTDRGVRALISCAMASGCENVNIVLESTQPKGVFLPANPHSTSGITPQEAGGHQGGSQTNVEDTPSTDGDRQFDDKKPPAEGENRTDDENAPAGSLSEFLVFLTMMGAYQRQANSLPG